MCVALNSQQRLMSVTHPPDVLADGTALLVLDGPAEFEPDASGVAMEVIEVGMEDIDVEVTAASGVIVAVAMPDETTSTKLELRDVMVPLHAGVSFIPWTQYQTVDGAKHSAEVDVLTLLHFWRC